MDATRCISMYYIYIHRRRRRRIVVRRPSSCPYPNASIARDTHACIHASIHPSIHPSTARSDATRRFPRRLDDAQKKSHARKYYDASTTRTPRTWIFVALKAATRETKEDARRADIVCVCVRECRARRDRGGGGGRRHDDSDIRRMHGDARAGRLPRPWSWSSSVDGTPRARGRDWSHF